MNQQPNESGDSAAESQGDVAGPNRGTPAATKEPCNNSPRFIVSLARRVDAKKARIDLDLELADVAEYIRTGERPLAVVGSGLIPLAKITDKIQRTFSDVLAKSNGNRDAAKGAIADMKAGLPVMLACGQFSKQNNKCLISASGLVPVDYDALGDKVEEVRKKLQASESCALCYKSPSGDGLKALLRITPAQNNEEHYSRYHTACEHAKTVTGIDPRLEDDSGKDIARRSFLCHDESVYYNPSAGELELVPLPQEEPAKREERKERPEAKAQAGHESAERKEKPSKEQVRELLDFVPPRPDYSDWVRIISAVGDALSDQDAVEVLSAWSGEEKPGEYKAKLKKREKKITVGTLFHYAKQHGWNGFSSRTGLAKRRYKTVDLVAIKPEPVAWVEEDYLARGEFHILQGQGGSYKGTLALNWAAEFSKRGEPVLLVLAEDDLAKKVKPVLMAADASMPLIHPLVMHSGESVDALVLPDDLPELERAIEEMGGARFVVIDPLLSHVSGQFDSHRDHDMKRVLTQISKLAQSTNTTILGVHHTKKDTSGGMKLAGMGSIAFYTTARVVMAMAKISEEEAVLEVVKSNIGREGARQLLLAEIVEVAPGINMPKLTRAGESSVSVEEALTSAKKERGNKTLAAAKVILDILEAEGAQDKNPLLDRVSDETGMAVSSIQKHVCGFLLKEELIENYKTGFKGGWAVTRTKKERPAKLAKNKNGHVVTFTPCPPSSKAA